MFGRKSVYWKHTETPQKTCKTPSKKLYKHNKAKQVNCIVKNATKTGNKIDDFELEYQKFIAELKAKKAKETKDENEQEITE